MRMNETERVLLQLTGRALFNALADFDPATTDWFTLYQETSCQALTTLIWDILKDEERTCIPDEISERWEQNSLFHIIHNEQLLYEQRQVINLLNAAGIPCMILKGSSSAVCYPNPSLRIMGDIDLLVKPEQQKAAVEILQAGGYGEVLDENHHCHMSISKGGITVEIHKEPNGLFLNEESECVRKIRAYFNDAIERMQYVGDLPVLADDQQAIVLLIHKMEHFMTSGLGLRQMCDWAVFVKSRLNSKLWEQLQPKLAEFGILYFAGIMTRACVAYLGLPEEFAPWAMEYDAETANKVIEQILKEGNFGIKSDKYAERLFSNPGSANRLASFFTVLFSASRSNWPVCKQHPVLLPVAPFVLFGRYLMQRGKGERPKLNLIQKYRQAGMDQKLYQSLRPFMSRSLDGNQ